MNSAGVFGLFVAAINRQDVAGLRRLMTEGHVFVDGLGNRAVGAEMMQAGWTGYFAMCPDYWIRPDTVIGDGDVVLAAGEAGGSIKGMVWRTPAAWKAVIEHDRVAEWRVFADNKPVYEILAKG
jgi:ketosteroid isomerase-like protein